MTDQTPSRAPAVVWLPALAVALGAVAATAHGLYEVAVAARVPWGVALLYPIITDGLALVSYAATRRLTGSAVAYAWTVTIVAAGLSGLAQATYLASTALDASAELRFGVGAWPAVAAAVVAHLLYLLAGDRSIPAAPVEVAPIVTAVEEVADQPAPDLRTVADEVAARRVALHSVLVPSASPLAKPATTVSAQAATPAPERPARVADDLPAVVFDASAPQEERLAAIYDAGRGRGTVAEAFGLDDSPARRLWTEYRARREREAVHA